MIRIVGWEILGRGECFMSNDFRGWILDFNIV